MGWWITLLRRLAEAWAGDAPRRLRLAGSLITLLLVGGSGLAGWGLEQLGRRLATHGPLAAASGLVALVIALASALAARSLEQAVREVLRATSLGDARQALGWIVGRDTAELDGAEILRAAAETASENGVDGLFAPLFWMLAGAGLWSLNPALPGPLALGWGFKAASTLDSMLGYRRGRLRWLGTAGARLDDLLVWLPCRLVALSLPLAAGRPGSCGPLLAAALRDGAADPSPNAGVSQAAYAHVAGVQLGGCNRYGGQIRRKPVLAEGLPPADAMAIERILNLNHRLEAVWLAVAGSIAISVTATQSFITKTLS